jgi:hypothetical protein
MAITQTQALPAPFITALGEKYGTGLAGLADQPFTTAQLGQVAPQVAGQTALQQQATTLATQGLGGYAPYLTGAAAAGQAPGAAPMGLEAYGGLGTAAGLTGPMTTAQTSAYMSPYQQAVIDATLGEYDIQAAKGIGALGTAAVGAGAFGGGRHGIAEAEYQSQSDRNRAALQAGMLEQGFGQAQQARQQDLMNQMGISQAQLGLGQYQAGLGATTQQLAGGDIGMAGQVGATNQAQAQAVADAQREANRMTLYEPYERLGFFGQGLTGLMGGYPAQYQSQIQPNPTPLQSALGIGSVLGGIYGNIRGRQT